MKKDCGLTVIKDEAFYFADTVIPTVAKLRAVAEALEIIVDKNPGPSPLTAIFFTTFKKLIFTF